MKFRQVLTIFFLTAATLGVEASLLALSNWQRHRYHQRLDEQAEFSARQSQTVSGTFLNSRTFALTNQPNPADPENDTGWRILTPLQTTSGTLVIDRGFTHPTLNPDGTPDFTLFNQTSATVSGIYQPFPQRHGWLQGPDTTTNPHLLAFLNPGLLVSETTPSYLIARTGTSPHLAAVPPPLPAADRHLSYMLQWLGMAIAFPVLCLYGFLKNRRRKPRS